MTAPPRFTPRRAIQSIAPPPRARFTRAGRSPREEEELSAVRDAERPGLDCTYLHATRVFVIRYTRDPGRGRRGDGALAKRPVSVWFRKKLKKCCGPKGKQPMSGGMRRPSFLPPGEGGVDVAVPRGLTPEYMKEMMGLIDDLQFGNCGSEAEAMANPAEYRRVMDRMNRFLEKQDSIVKSTSPPEGFAYVGKLKGGEARAFALAAQSVLRDIVQANADLFEKQLPFFNAMSPHHRVEAIAAVTEGLLDPSSPSPAETHLNHEAYMAVWYNLLTLVVMECDIAAEEARTGIYQPDADDEMDETCLEASMDYTRMGMAKKIVEKEEEAKLAKKVQKLMKKDEISETESARPIREGRKLLAKRAEEEDVSKEKMLANMMDTVKPEKTGGIKFVQREDVDAMLKSIEDDNAMFDNPTFWRATMKAMTYERFCNRPLAMDVKLTETDSKSWNSLFRLVLGSGFYPCEDAREFMQFNAADHELFLTDGNARRKLTRFNSLVEAATAKHESTWTPAKTGRAISVIEFACDDVNDHEWIRDMRKPGEKGSESMKKYTEAADPKVLQLPSGYDHVSYDSYYRFKKFARWRQPMEARGRRYDKIEDRYAALRDVDDAEFVVLPQFQLEAIYSEAPEAPNDKPWDWRSLKISRKARLGGGKCANCYAVPPDGSSFKKCPECDVARYCGKECQVAHRSDHKETCVMLRAIKEERAKKKSQEPVHEDEIQTSAETNPRRRFIKEALGSDRKKDDCACCGLRETGGRASYKRCGGCESVKYCSVDCQRAYWKDHKTFCRAHSSRES